MGGKGPRRGHAMKKAPIVALLAITGALLAVVPAIPQAQSTYTFYVAAE